MTQATCYGCKCVEENGPLSAVFGPPSCIPCAARSIAKVYAGQPKETTDAVMRQAWVDTKTFTEGRRLFWNWAKAIEEAKTNQGAT